MAKRRLPPNLYERRGYFSWRNPHTREEFGLGRERTRACIEAIEANIHIAKLDTSKRLVHRIAEANAPTHRLADWNDKYLKQLLANERSANSLRSAKCLGARMVRMLGDVPVDSITSLAVAKAIDDVVAEGKVRMAQALRGFMRDSLREARVAGWLTKENPVLDTRLGVRVKVMRSRLSLEQFRLVYEKIDEVWLRNAVDLALVTGQRRDDISHATFKDFRDGHWWLVQRKTGHRVALPMSLTLDAIGKSLEDVVSQCRRSGVLSKHLVHQTARRGNSPIGRHIWVDTISRRFAEAVEAAGVDWGTKTPATFHELRSLSVRLYAAQGGVNTQSLLGHRSAEMTEKYEDDRGTGWVHVSFSR